MTFSEHFDPRQDGRSNFQVGSPPCLCADVEQNSCWSGEVMSKPASASMLEKHDWQSARAEGPVLLKSGCAIFDTPERGTSCEWQDSRPTRSVHGCELRVYKLVIRHVRFDTFFHGCTILGKQMLRHTDHMCAGHVRASSGIREAAGTLIVSHE